MEAEHPEMLDSGLPSSAPVLGNMKTGSAATSSIYPTTADICSGKSIEHPKKEEQSRPSQWTSEWISNWWGIELICWMISALSLVAIVITLESHKNQPMPEWGLGITLNSLVSVLATIGQMAMMKPIVECISQLKWLWFIRKQKLSSFELFDGASRGPTGSLLLLGKIRGFHLVSLGAVISIVSVAFGPFAQQVVSYPLLLNPIGIAGAQQVLNYTVQSGIDISAEELLNSMNNGLNQGNSSLSTVIPSCSTGNCTWDLYESLAFCSSVVDISSSLVKNGCNLTNFEQGFEKAGFSNPGYPCFNYTLPYMTLFSTEATSIVPQQDRQIATLSNSNYDPNDPSWMNVMVLLPAAGKSSTLATLYLMYQPNLYGSINSSLPDPVAYEINLNLCIQTYNTSLLNGATNTTVVRSQILDTDMVVNEAEETDGADVVSYNTTNSDGYYFSDGANSFGVSNNTATGIAWIVEVNFNYGCQDYIALSEGEGDIQCSQNSAYLVLNALTNSTDPLFALTSMWESMVVSMTNTLRSGANGAAYINQFPGTAKAPVAFVKTNYLWLLLPIGLVSLTLIFLLATILKSKRLGSRVWKSSNLAILQGLHHELHTELSGLSSITDMEEKAKEVNARLDMKAGRADGGVEYRLVKERQELYWR